MDRHGTKNTKRNDASKPNIEKATTAVKSRLSVAVGIAAGVLALSLHSNRPCKRTLVVSAFIVLIALSSSQVFLYFSVGDL